MAERRLAATKFLMPALPEGDSEDADAPGGVLNHGQDLCLGAVQQVVMTSGLAWVACVEGQLTEAGELAGRALASAEPMGLTGHPIMVEILCAQGRVAFERGDLVSAERLFEQSLSISEGIRPALALVSQLLLARVWLSDGRVGDALDGIAHARAFLPPDSTSPLRGLCDALEGRIATTITRPSAGRRVVPS